MFRSTVQPAELARAAGKEMTRSKKLGLDKMYVANVYFVFISPRDADAMGDLVTTIEGELETYLLAFMRERDYAAVTRPVVRFSVDDSIKRQGKFDIIGQQMKPDAIYEELGSVPGVTDDLEAAQRAAERVHAPAPAPAAPVTPLPSFVDDMSDDFVPTPMTIQKPDPWADAPDAAAAVPAVAPPAAPIPSVPAAVPAPAPMPEPARLTRVGTVIIPERGEVELSQARKTYTLGRQSTCDLPVPDANISRQHAELFWDGEGWSLRDLGSTNGTSVNGHRLTGPVELHDGDNITLGISTLVYHEVSRMV